MNHSLHRVSRILIAVSALALISAYYTPLWQILMWAPQYPEGLEMKIWINNLTGNVRIISALNHYIGMRTIEVEMFPEFKYMIYIVGGIIAIGLGAALINKRWALLTFFISIALAGLGALIDFYMWGYDYGHNLNPDAPIRIPGMSYQPPLIGTKQLLNFTAFSGPDTGGWIFMGAALVVFVVLILEQFFFKRK
jgi:copper chaperone NosL